MATPRKDPPADGRCGAKTGAGTPCRRIVPLGMLHCKQHGGYTFPSVKAAADERKEVILAGRAIDKKAEAGTLDPVGAIFDEMENNHARAVQFVRVLEGFLEVIGPPENWSHETVTGSHLKAQVAAYSKSMMDLHKIQNDYLRLGIADRRQKLDEELAGRILKALWAFARALDLTREQQKLAIAAAPMVLAGIDED